MKLPLVLFLFLIIFQKTYSAENEQQGQARAVMDNVYDSYVKLIPYIYSTQNNLNGLQVSSNQTKKKEKDELLKNLNDLSLAFRGAKHATFLNRPSFGPSLETINNHLDETILSVESDSFLFAQKRLNALGALCVSCHAQLPESVSKNAFGNNIKSEKRELFDSDFAYANYLFIIRNFDSAKSYFEKVIENNSKKSNDIL